ncbi:DM13 domain-containing protein [Promethearchaeum syntrophicum]|uniref:DM13 domain-containing protein n=1 Tax=Promethearchaeum syntrophicum TaxID=2594042 RepID=A0A5B9DBZ7_9ARCH|nr:DM13 domain-containing protein [Candidatus Prometheoarchaeum syntrophicum]QEE16280.1 Electron transfer DM13 [Candidatus Prometheoarchaeum syntrophicum]
MKKKLLLFIIIGGIIIGGGSLGVYYYLNPLGTGNQSVVSGTILSERTLIDMDSSHKGSGTVHVVEIDSDTIELQYINVEITNGPDLFVYLSKTESFSHTDDPIGTFVNLGELTYNSGNFTYTIQSSVQLDDYHSVVIYCRQYSVIFAYAALNSTE